MTISDVKLKNQTVKQIENVKQKTEIYIFYLIFGICELHVGIVRTVDKNRALAMPNIETA